MLSRVLRLAAALWLAAGLALLAGCGNTEAEQRAAFIQFLQSRVLDQPGVRVPKPTPEQTKAFGDYAQQYAVITDFNAEMDKSVGQPMNAVIAKSAPRSLGDIVSRRDDIRAAHDGIKAIRAALDQNLTKADAARAQLQQPPELKLVFDKAYEKTVTRPAATFKEVFPALDQVLGEAIKIGDYIDAQKSQITVSGNTITVDDPTVRNELNRMLTELNSRANAINAAQERLRELMR